MKCTLVALSAFAFLVGCASVEVTRISHDNWKSVKGFRYYLPRPYVVVKDAYPVAGADYLVPAVVQPDGRFKVVAESLSPEVRADLAAAGVPLVFSRDEIRVPQELAGQSTPAAAGTSEVQPQASTPTSSATTAPAAPTSVANDAMMTGSKVEPTTLHKDQRTFLVTAKVAKNSSSAPIQISDPAAVVVGLVPFDSDGNPKTSGFVALEGLPSSTTQWKADTDGSYVASGSRELLPGPGSYSIALKFSGTVGAVTGSPLILHQGTPPFSVVGPAGKPQAPAEPKKQEKGSESSGHIEYGGTKGLLATSGDPDTNPFVKLDNGFFDILYLPDLEEQYAIDVHGGLGSAGLQLGFENGWMMERATAQADNTELGKFIFRNIDKFTDIGALALKVAINPVLAGIPASSEAAQQSKTQGTVATLRIMYSLEAQPGLYPILKMSEGSTRPKVDNTISGPSRFLYLASLPDTRVSYNVRRTLAVQLVSLTPPTNKSGDGQSPEGCAPGTKILPHSLSTTLAMGEMATILKALPGVNEDAAARLLPAITGYGQREKNLILCVTSNDEATRKTLASLSNLNPIPKTVTEMGFEKIEVIVK